MSLMNMTQEEREISLAKAREARKIKQKERENNIHNLKDDYLDCNYWRDLASEYGVRMPNMYDPPSVKIFNRIRKKLDISLEEWNNSYTSFNYFCKHNPRYSMFAMAGLLLELAKEKV